MTTRFLTADEVVAYHRRLMSAYEQEPVLVSRERLEAAVSRPSAAAFGVEVFPDLAGKAAALLQAIVIAHPFLDGNKRAAFGAMLYFLELNGVSIDGAVAHQTALVELVIGVASGKVREVPQIAEMLGQWFDF